MKTLLLIGLIAGGERHAPLLQKQEREPVTLDLNAFVDDTLGAGEATGGLTVVKRVPPEMRRKKRAK